MKNLLDFALQERYDKVKKLRPNLEEMKTTEKFLATFFSRQGRNYNQKRTNGMRERDEFYNYHQHQKR